MENKKATADSILISYSATNGRDNGVLIIGRKRKNESVEIINAFQGEEAYELWTKLTTSKGVKDA